ncbi:hypothetical protein [Luedemannella helvata]|uniref:Uncharacterized protein n=1 Tax=Luedemannella helvata TaxID=349315 RepID=A0ABP4VVP9_9ACTN
MRLLPPPTPDGALPWRTPILTFLIFCVPLGLAMCGASVAFDLRIGGDVAPLVVSICSTWAWFVKGPRHRGWAVAAVMGMAIAAGGFVHSGGSEFEVFLRALGVALAGAYAFAFITHLPVDGP